MAYAEDVNLTGDYVGLIDRNADMLLNACKDICLAVNTGKTNYMQTGRHRGMVANGDIRTQGPFNKYRDWFTVSSTQRWMEVRPVGLVEGSPTTQAHFSSVACGHALRQEVDFCDV